MLVWRQFGRCGVSNTIVEHEFGVGFSVSPGLMGLSKPPKGLPLILIGVA